MGEDQASLEQQLSALVADRGRHLLAVAWQLTHDRAAAEDIVQNALERVYRSLSRRRSCPDDLEAYVRRALLNKFRRAGSRHPRRSRIARRSADSVTNRPWCRAPPSARWCARRLS